MSVRESARRHLGPDAVRRVGAVALAVTAGLALTATPGRATDILAKAVGGSPYGVATIELPLANPIVGNPLPPLRVSDDHGRVLYPIARDRRVPAGQRPSERPVPRPGRGRLLGRLGELIREIASEDDKLEQTVARQVSFLIRGEEPIDIRLADRRGEIGTYRLHPVDEPAARQEMLQAWWSTYTAAAKRQIDAADYPPWVETYLVAMLSGRLGLPLPDWYPAEDRSGDSLVDTLKLVAGAGGVDNDLFALAAAGRGLSRGEASLPLPPPPAWRPPEVEPVAADVETEPIADRVPPECFYIRYGSFANYIWFRDLSDEYGGDISRMVTLKGVVDDAAARIEDQLSVQTNELSRMLGGAVIEDQALFGRDLFLADGSSIGVIFHARNLFLLRTSLNQERAGRAAADPAVRLTDVEIAGRPATLLRSADNRVRSFLVEDGPYICVTNSRTLAERFLQVGRSGDSLARTATFRASRGWMPLSRGDTIFAYFSPEFLQQLVSPQTLIELRRRLDAKADIALAYLARLVAESEGSPARGIEELMDAGYLPTTFGARGDGSGVMAVGDRWLDSRRGGRGRFLPIADTDVDQVTPAEAGWYGRIAAEYESNFRGFDPIMVGLRRQTLGDESEIERLSVHAEIAPFRPEKYGKLAEQLGPPTRVAIEFAPDDIVAAQAHVTSAQLGPPTHLFAAIKDSRPPDPQRFDGVIRTFLALREIPGYLGAWPQPGALDRLPLGLGQGQPVGPGMSRLIGGVYRYTGGGFSVLSFWPDLLQATLPHLGATEVDDTAQIRVRVGNLAGSRLQGWVNGQLYDRAAEASLAGAHFLNLLSRQLHVPADEAPDVAAAIFGMPLQCSLGGEYRFDGNSGRWASTAWRGPEPEHPAPADYVAPIMVWFRGADARVTQLADRVIADVNLDIARGRPE